MCHQKNMQNKKKKIAKQNKRNKCHCKRVKHTWTLSLTAPFSMQSCSLLTSDLSAVDILGFLHFWICCFALLSLVLTVLWLVLWLINLFIFVFLYFVFFFFAFQSLILLSSVLVVIVSLFSRAFLSLLFF